MSRKPSPLGPIPSRRRASLAARALSSCTEEELDCLLQGGPLPRLRARLARLAETQRYEEAARLRDRVEALEQLVKRLRSLERLRKLEVCLIAPMTEPGWQKAFFVCAGRRLRGSGSATRCRCEARGRSRAGALPGSARRCRGGADSRAGRGSPPHRRVRPAPSARARRAAPGRRADHSPSRGHAGPPGRVTGAILRPTSPRSSVDRAAVS